MFIFNAIKSTVKSFFSSINNALKKFFSIFSFKKTKPVQKKAEPVTENDERETSLSGENDKLSELREESNTGSQELQSSPEESLITTLGKELYDEGVVPCESLKEKVSTETNVAVAEKVYQESGNYNFKVSQTADMGGVSLEVMKKINEIIKQKTPEQVEDLALKLKIALNNLPSKVATTSFQITSTGGSTDTYYFDDFSSSTISRGKRSMLASNNPVYANMGPNAAEYMNVVNQEKGNYISENLTEDVDSKFLRTEGLLKPIFRIGSSVSLLCHSRSILVDYPGFIGSSIIPSANKSMLASNNPVYENMGPNAADHIGQYVNGGEVERETGEYNLGYLNTTPDSRLSAAEINIYNQYCDSKTIL